MKLQTTPERSDLMKRVRRTDTDDELFVRKQLFRAGFRFRKNVKDLPGSPDIVLAKYKMVVFVNGCFWHGHECALGRLPTSNAGFWSSKIAANSERDGRKADALRNLGYEVHTVWRCSLGVGVEHVLVRLRELRSKLRLPFGQSG